MALFIHAQINGHRIISPDGTKNVHFALGQVAAPITGDISLRDTVEITGDIGENGLTAPLNVLTRNAGNGTIEMRWDPADGAVDHYDIYISSSDTGTFTLANFRPIYITKAKIPNIPFGTKVYAKVQAVSPDGLLGPFSALALDAVVSRAVTRLFCTGLVGDQVKSGTIFAAICNDELVAVRTLVDGIVV